MSGAHGPMRRLTHYAKRLAAEPRPLRFLAARLLWATRTCRFLVIRKQGFRLRFYPSSMSALYWTDPTSRADDEAIVRGCLTAGDTCVDVGANVGVLTLTAAVTVGAEGRVYAFEPHPRIHGYLVGNIALNGLPNVRTFPIALGDRDGSVGFDDRRADDMNAVAAGPGRLWVATRRLDEIELGPGRIALVKLDVEGYELMVLRGAAAVLARTETVYVEVCEPHFAARGYTTGDVVALLEASGFTCFRLTEPGALVRATPAFRAERLQNLLAAREPDRLAARVGRRIVTS